MRFMDLEARNYVNLTKDAMRKARPTAPIAAVAKDLTEYLNATEDQPTCVIEHAALLQALAEYLLTTSAHVETTNRAAFAAHIYLMDTPSLELWERAFDKLPSDKTKVDFLAEELPLVAEYPRLLTSMYHKLEGIPDSQYKAETLQTALDDIAGMHNLIETTRHSRSPEQVARDAVEKAATLTRTTAGQSPAPPNAEILAFVDEFKRWAAKQQQTQRGRD